MIRRVLERVAGLVSENIVVVAAEATHTLYSRVCLPFIEERLRAEELKITGFYDRVRVRYVAEGEIRRFDPELVSSFNVNSPQDLERARALAAEGR